VERSRYPHCEFITLITRGREGTAAAHNKATSSKQQFETFPSRHFLFNNSPLSIASGHTAPTAPLLLTRTVLRSVVPHLTYLPTFAPARRPVLGGTGSTRHGMVWSWFGLVWSGSAWFVDMMGFDLHILHTIQDPLVKGPPAHDMFRLVVHRPLDRHGLAWHSTVVGWGYSLLHLRLLSVPL
jgi:hypothetical protein